MTNKPLTNITQPQIMKILDVCNGHIKRESRCWVSENAMIEGQYGWLVSVTRLEDYYIDAPDIAECKDPIPAEVQTILEWAVAQDCDFVLFDADGSVYEQLEWFDW